MYFKEAGTEARFDQRAQTLMPKDNVILSICAATYKSWHRFSRQASQTNEYIYIYAPI